MNKEHLYLLLDIVFRNGSINRLTRKGVDYNDIALQMNNAIKEKLIGYSEEKIALTEQGLALYEKLKASYKKVKKDEWIEKDKKSQVAKIDKNAIFVPRQSELTFLIRSLK